MLYEKIGDVNSGAASPTWYRLAVENLSMIIIMIDGDTDIFELKFNGVQHYRFFPDDLVKLPENVQIDAFQRALDSDWISELRVPSQVHHDYLRNHNFYVLHVTDIGLFEVAAVSAELRELGIRDSN